MVKLSSLSLATTTAANAAATPWRDAFHSTLQFKEVTEGNFTTYQFHLDMPEHMRPEGMNQHLRIPATGARTAVNLYPSLPANKGGIVGLAIDGKPIWSPLYQHGDNSTCCDAGLISAPLADECHCMLGTGYIKAPVCLIQDKLDNDTCHDEVTVGVALDGFKLKIGGARLTLDECGGADNGEEYAYYFTDTYPYSLRCFKGTPMIPVDLVETPDLTNAQCPDIYEAMSGVNHLIQKMKASNATEEAPRAQRSRSSTAGRDDDIINSIVDFVKSVSDMKVEAPSVNDLLDTLTNRKRRSFNELFKTGDGAKMKPESRMDDDMSHIDHDAGVLPYGVYQLYPLDKCGYNDAECLTPCTNSAYHDCNPETDSCLGFYGLYQKAVVCPGVLTQPVPLKSNKFHYKKSDLMMAQRKGSRANHKSTPLSMGRMMMDEDEDVTCYCRDFTGAKIDGTEQTFQDFDFTDKSNTDLAAKLGCLLCPANLIQADEVYMYESCEQPGLTIYPDAMFINQTVFSLDENYPLHSRCTCPPGTIWSNAQMWCVPREHCLPAEIGVPVGCSTKSMMMMAIGMPPLDCDVTDPHDFTPDYYCVETVDGRLMCAYELDKYGNVMNNATFIDETEAHAQNKETYHMEDDEWCTEWYNYNNVGSWQEGNRISHYEYERFDEYFFDMIECDPIKMILSQADTTTVYTGKEHRGKRIFGEVEQSLTFRPRGDHESPLANFACYTTTHDGAGTFQCKDVKIKFICRDWTPQSYAQDDHYGYDDHGYPDYSYPDYSHYANYDVQTAASDYDGYNDMTHASYQHQTTDSYIEMEAAMDYGSGHYSSPRPSAAYGHDYGVDIYSSSTYSPQLEYWQKEQAAQEVRDEQYFMILENYGCTLLWFEFYQAKMYAGDNLVEGCVESINTVYDVCLRRWENEDWAQSFDYNAVVDHMVAWEKQKFCYSKSAPMIEHHKKKERTMNAYEAYKDQIREQVQDGLIEAYAGCFDPMVEIMVDEARYSREVCQASHRVHKCVGETVTMYIDEAFAPYNLYYGSHMAEAIMNTLMEFSPGCEAHFPAKKILGCSAKEHLENVIECDKMYIFNDMPLHDRTPDALLRFGICTYLKVEQCNDPYNDVSIPERVEHTVEWITREVPPFAFTIVNLLRTRFPRSLEETIEFGTWIASQFVEGIEEKVAKAEKLVGFTAYELITRVIGYFEQRYCDDSESQPILAYNDVCMQLTWDVMNADTPMDVCQSFRNWESTFFTTQSKCSKFHEMLTCHVTALEFIRQLWGEIKANIDNFKLKHMDYADDEMREWLAALDYVMPMADGFIQNELEHMMTPIASWIISLFREINQLLVVFIEDANFCQYACKPTPGEWSEWSGVECTQQCAPEGDNVNRECKLMRFRECRDSNGDVIPKENAAKECADDVLYETEMRKKPKCDVCSLVEMKGNDSKKIEVNCSDKHLSIVPFSIITTSGGSKELRFGDDESVKVKDIGCINLSNNNLGDECWPMIEQILMDAEKRIQDVRLDNNQFTHVPMNLFNCFKKKSSLCLKNNNISEVKCEPGNNLASAPKNMIVNMCNNPITMVPFQMGSFIARNNVTWGYENDDAEFEVTLKSAFTWGG